MQNETHSFLDGKVHLYRRERSKYWQCSTYLAGRNHRISTKEESLTLAKEFAREWYMAAYLATRQSRDHRRTESPLRQIAHTSSLPLNRWQHKELKLKEQATPSLKPQKNSLPNTASLPKGSGIKNGRSIMKCEQESI